VRLDTTEALRMTTVLMQIKVKPRARMSALTQTADGTWLAS
jgi:hypothetical protein